MTSHIYGIGVALGDGVADVLTDYFWLAQLAEAVVTQAAEPDNQRYDSIAITFDMRTIDGTFTVNRLELRVTAYPCYRFRQPHPARPELTATAWCTMGSRIQVNMPHHLRKAVYDAADRYKGRYHELEFDLSRGSAIEAAGEVVEYMNRTLDTRVRRAKHQKGK